MRPCEKSGIIVLIGMPGSGKSTVGVVLAKMTSRAFIDTDLLIQTAEGCSLQHIVDTDGYMALRRIEEKILLGIAREECVIATGGSAVYSERAMLHLKSLAVVVFLDVDPATLLARVSDYDTRGLAKRPDQTFGQLFEERYALYTRYADIIIDSMDCKQLTQEGVCRKIIEAVGMTNTPE